MYTFEEVWTTDIEEGACDRKYDGLDCIFLYLYCTFVYLSTFYNLYMIV